ncbi:hypothetical protein [Hasllibacter sp. MH4015]|uniref:hypothetical protein n=1 Tax=Hasllibacter sp. MH4015 TaxID=2854029 RepID=UPI001CD30D08|nr:hypothetical protein [Hasllibacter sp. MH4015]
MTPSLTKTIRLATAAAIVAASGLAATVATAQTFEPGFIQSLSVTSTRGESQMDQFFNDATSGNPAITRVCVVNFGSVQRAFTHTVAGINPLIAQPGSQSCANFDSSSRVAFGMVDGLEPAQANRAMVMNLDAFAGGTVSFVWQ